MPKATITGSLEVVSGALANVGGGASLGVLGPDAAVLFGAYEPTVTGVDTTNCIDLLIAD